MKTFIQGTFFDWRLCACLIGIAAGPGFSPPGLASVVNVPENHNHDSRDGLYIDPAFTKAAAAVLKRDLSFNGSIAGNVYAQPLYIEGGPSGQAVVIAVTESNNVYALDPAYGNVIWKDHVGAPVPLSSLPCGNINPLGITGTPAVDLASRSVCFDAMTTPDGGATKKHLIFALNVDTGATNAGFPVDVSETARFGNLSFDSTIQNQRSAIACVNGIIYATYSGHAGDCDPYHGWIVGVALNDPTNVLAWATAAQGGGIWGVGGPASDGTNIFLTTGNTFNAATWGGGEALIRFQAGPVFSSNTIDFWAPTNWSSLDGSDTDLGGSGTILVTVPGANPSNLMVALGKDGYAYLLNRTNLGGITTPLAKAHLAGGAIIQAGAAYQTAKGTYVAFRNGSSVSAFRINPASPPTITGVWTNSQNGNGSPFVTSTDGTNNVVVWGIGAGGNQRVYGFDGDTGEVVFSGGGANELMANTQSYNTGIAARGRIYVAGDNKVFAFAAPISPIVLTNAMIQPGIGFGFSFMNVPGISFTAFGSTDITLPFSAWSSLGSITDNPPGTFQFFDPGTATNQLRFYQVRSP